MPLRSVAAVPRTILLAAAWVLPAAPAAADPWLGPGDSRVRHDLTILADAGLVRTPISTWPLSWPDVSRDIAVAAARGGYPPAVEQALARVGRAARFAAARGWSGIGVLVAAAVPEPVRGFQDSPRQEGEAGLVTSWLGDRAAAAIEVMLVTDPADDQRVRLDGSYVGMSLGNFMVSAGAMERWWGPGWDGSLILSSNARPVPGITVERNYTDASRWPLLKWLGPWRASLSVGQAEGSDVAVADVRILAARLTFRPRSWLEFGLSRAAQWCGEGRPCGTQSFLDLLVGRDNRSDSLTIDDEPGNQLAGYDFRIRMPWQRLAAAVYAQGIGEDEAGGLPSKFLGLVGLEVSGGTEAGSWRARLEYADTACEFTRRQPEYNCAYRNGLYPQGFAYRTRPIGHAVDGDGRMLTAAFLFVRPEGTTFGVRVRDLDLNRDGAPDPIHALAPAAAASGLDVEVTLDAGWFDGRLQIGAGYAGFSRAKVADDEVRGFVRYSRGL